MIFCQFCGTEKHETAVACPKCGASTTVNTPGEKKILIAALLCFFLGYLGVHRFYVGKIGTGILLPLSFLFFGAGFLWWLIDFIMIIAGAFKDKSGKQLTNWT
jgi:TM2 domain-containing membrane protein YozV